jgi:hypothetical protein
LTVNSDMYTFLHKKKTQSSPLKCIDPPYQKSLAEELLYWFNPFFSV